MYKALTPLLPSLSGMCLVQIAMLGTPMEIFDPGLMRTILNLLCKQKEDLRVRKKQAQSAYRQELQSSIFIFIFF